MLIGLLDRIFFTFGVILFLQLPAFIDQYTHRLGGYQRAQINQIDSFRRIADKNYGGKIEELIRDFKKSSTISVRDTAKNIQTSLNTSIAIENELEVLEENNLTKKLLFLSTNLRYDLANDTLKQFSPSFPLNIQSLLYGIFGGLFASATFGLLFRVPLRLINKRRVNKPKQHLMV